MTGKHAIDLLSDWIAALLLFFILVLKINPCQSIKINEFFFAPFSYLCALKLSMNETNVCKVAPDIRNNVKSACPKNSHTPKFGSILWSKINRNIILRLREMM